MQSRFTRRARVAAAAIALLAAAATAPSTATATSIAPVTANQVATEMAELLKLQPTGIQVSDNALYFPDTETSVVWPSPGQTAAPAGLGANLRPDALKRAGITSVAAQFGTQTVHGCPSGLTIKDYYCFYTEYNFGGRRLQFTGATKASDAATWNFDNQTRSWVNTDTDCIPLAFDGATHTGTILWQEPENSSNSRLGVGQADKMSSWTCD